MLRMFFMSKKIKNPFVDPVFSLSDDDFDSLLTAIDLKIDKARYGFTSFEEAALFYGREPVCPECGSNSYFKEETINAGRIRYRCKDCDSTYILLADSIFNSAKISLHKLMNYIQLMSFNVPLDLLCEVLDISKNTAELWRKKIFETVNCYQDHLVLSDTIFIDETYLEDYEVEAISKANT